MELKEKIRNSKALFFDLFHTLFSVVSTPEAKRTGDILGIPDDIWVKMLFESSEERLRGIEKDKYSITRKLAHQYNPDIPEEIIRKAADTRQKRFHNALANEKSDKIEILDALRKTGKKIGLVSNADAVEISGWKYSQFAPHFDSVVFSYEIGYVKPEPDIYEHAMSTLKVTPEESLFIGDGSCNELAGAKNVGMTTVMTTEYSSILWPEKIPKIAVHADYEIKNFNELKLTNNPKRTKLND